MQYLLRKMQPITLYSMRTQVEPAARNAFRWHVSFFFSPVQFYPYMAYSNDFVLIVCFYSIAGLSEESIYHTRKFSHATVVMYFTETCLFLFPYFFLFNLLFQTLIFFSFFFFTKRRFILRIL